MVSRARREFIPARTRLVSSLHPCSSVTLTSWISSKFVDDRRQEITTHKALLLNAAAILTVASFAAAAEIEVKTLSKGSDRGKMVFEPTLVKIEPGDTIKFVAADK